MIVKKKKKYFFFDAILDLNRIYIFFKDIKQIRECKYVNLVN